MQLTFDEESHIYRINGNIVPSVTQLCAPLAYEKAANANPWLRDVAANRGTRIHQYCEDIDLGADPGAYDPDCVGYVKAYKDFLRDYRITGYSMVERRIGSESLGCAGTLDRLFDGKRMEGLLDIKTGSKPDPATCIAQLAGYRAIFRADYDMTIYTLRWLILFSDGKYRLCEASDVEAADKLFQRLLEIHKLREEINDGQKRKRAR